MGGPLISVYLLGEVLKQYVVFDAVRSLFQIQARVNRLSLCLNYIRLPLWSRIRPLSMAFQVLGPTTTDLPSLMESCERVCHLFWDEVSKATSEIITFTSYMAIRWHYGDR